MRKLLLITTALFLFFNSKAQTGKLEYSGFFDSYYYKGLHNLNFTANLGSAFYRGDLCDLCMQPSFSGGIGVNYKLWPRVMFGFEFHYMKLQGKDQLSNRNLAFKSTNFEYLVYGRYYFVDDIIRVAADRSRPPKFLKAYLLAGVGLLQYSPSSYFTQPFPPTDSIYAYNESGGGMTTVLPLGFGLSWRISNRVSLITELAYRFTFTDYLDAVSKRGNPKKKDGYALLDFKLQISPFAKAKRKAKVTTPPQKYEGPKGTETWKNRKKEEPVKQNNNYYDEIPTEETPAEENPEENPTEEDNNNQEEETPSEDDGWGN